MTVREVRAAGHDALLMASALLQRARRADPEAGLWEAADVQWWWRSPRPSDEVEKLFWVDDDGPVAGVLLTGWTDAWQCDPVAVPGAAKPDPGELWARAIAEATEHATGPFVVPVRDDDPTLRGAAERSGMTVDESDATAWMEAAEGPPVSPPGGGFVLVDRAQRVGEPHPMRARNGDDIARRLEQCPLYDPGLDLAVETDDGQAAGYALFWFDPITRVGLVEPVRVEEAFQRRGLARALLSAGIDRLAARGAERVKISYETDAAAALYHGVGFRQTSTATWYRAPSG